MTASLNSNQLLLTLKPVLKATLIAGLLDLAAALLLYYVQTGKAPWIILEFIASGLLGKAAFAGGIAMYLAGFLLHFVVTFFFACFFFFVVGRIKAATKHRLPTAVLYGVFTWLVMNLLVLPLSRTPETELTLRSTVTGMLVLIICVGLPFALLLHHNKQIKKPVSYHRLI